MLLNHPNRPTNGALVHICSSEPFNHKSDDVQFRQQILCACRIKMRLTLNEKITPFSRRYISHIPFFCFCHPIKTSAHIYLFVKNSTKNIWFFLSSFNKILFVSHIVIFVSPTHRIKYVNISITSQANE